MSKPLSVGVAGLGTVGAGVQTLLPLMLDALAASLTGSDGFAPS